MAFSWSTYCRNVPRYSRARLVLFAAVLGFVASIPYLAGAPSLYGTTVGVVVGLLLPFVLRELIVLRPSVTQQWLRVHGIAIGVVGFARDLLPEAVFGSLLGGLAGAWVGIWFTFYSDDRIAVLSDPSADD